jgi:hypothetical protein
MEWTLHDPSSQEPLETIPYDRWVSPNGEEMAEFHRVESGYLLRFPGQTDVLIEGRDSRSDEFAIAACPVPSFDKASLETLLHNAVQPLVGNHTGGLFLHGSAVVVGQNDGSPDALEAVAFLGLSRGGKTTLAGSFARAGYPFLTEDVIELRAHDGRYFVQPKRSKLRLFADSARYLVGEKAPEGDGDAKHDLDAGEALPFADSPVPLSQIHLLGTDHRAPLSIRRFSAAEALSKLLPHAFILDVEDKARLRSHFTRIADLTQATGCYALDYTRDYSELPRVIEAVLTMVEQEGRD